MPNQKRTAHTPKHSTDLRPTLLRTKIKLLTPKKQNINNNLTMKEIAINSIKKQLINHPKAPSSKPTNKNKQKIGQKQAALSNTKTADHAPPMNFYLANRPFESRLHTQKEIIAIIDGFKQILSNRLK